MSAAAETAAPAKGGKKKLIMIGAIVLVLLLAGGGAMFMMKSKAAAHANAEGAGEEAATAHKSNKPDLTHPPTFLPLEPFVVNLADKDADRYAQVGITLEVDSAVFADQMKAYMPAIRNAILMILAQKTSRELLERVGKERLAAEVMRETVRPMGIEISAPKPRKKVEETNEEGSDEAPAPKREPYNPVRHVHFSNFIIQ